jgi:predicted alpha/beta superfamily hydrolase
MRFVHIAILLLSINVGYAQLDNKISIGQKDSIYSKILNESREIWVYLPQNYQAGYQYPVVYLLDGESFFHYCTGIISHLSDNSVIPQMIVVAIINTNRNRDLTPTQDSTSNTKPNGGGEIFISFLEKELIPYVESRYSTAPYRVIVGHSLGALLVVNILLNHTHLFNSYVALDPALWWDSMKLINAAPKILVEERFKDVTLFLAIANSLPQGMDSTQAKKDSTVYTLGIRSIFKFRDILENINNHNLRWQAKYYENEFHGSVPLIGSYDALKFIFDFYKRPSFQKLTDSTAIILENHYEKVSQKMKYKILPPESDIHGLIWRSMALEKNYDRAFILLQMYLKLYPDSQRAYEDMAQYYAGMGDDENSKKYYDRAKQLSTIKEDKR